jgi:PAS domain S-box-containing protein
VAPNEDDEELLRSVALQNAHSILVARQRAEQELLKAKDALERKTEELARSLAMLRATLESTTDGILVTDGAGYITGFNEKFVQMWRLPPDVMTSGEHRRLLDVTVEQVREPRRFFERIEEIYASSPPDTYDVLGLADGRVFERFSRIQFVDDRNVGRVWSFRDITERRRAEETLQNQSEWLRITLSSIGDAVISTDAEGKVTFVNGVAAALTGWAPADAVGQLMMDVFRIVNHVTRRPVENPALRALREGKVVGLANHTILIARDGTERPIDDSAAPMRDRSGAIVGAVLVFRDVTARIRAEEVQARLAAIVESSHDAVISKTLDGTIVSWNAEAHRLFGYTAEEAIGQKITLIIPPELWDEERLILEKIGHGERVEHFETVRVSKDGRRIDISLTISPIRDASGRVVGASKVGRDVTERKRITDALRDADRRKDEFLALLAHELRNPLAPLQNGLQIVRLAAAENDAVVQTRAMMERQLGHLVRLVDDLLDIARINQNKMELRRSRVLLTDVMNSAVETARPAIEAAGHELIVSAPAVPVELDADLTRLSQVFSNLLTNSAKYTEAAGQIWFEAERFGDEVLVSVRDRGIGIPAEALPHIFNMFSQVDRTLERATGGLGIGLALVAGLVEMHGGTVTAESPGSGQGSTFTVRLPIPDQQVAAPVETHTEGEGAKPPSRRILVVDDNQDSAKSMAMLLELLGNQVYMAHDGIRAVEAAERFRPEVVLMDMGMPRMNGYEATRRIREHAWGREMIIIALTGWGQEDDKARSYNAGCDGHLVKPIDLTNLEEVLTHLRPGRAAR